MRTIHFHLSLLSGIFALTLAPGANAAMTCESPSGSDFGDMLCRNTSPKGVSSVLFRNMPPWNGNSGITIIDICEGEIPKTLEPKQGCYRRQCSQAVDHLSMRFGPIIIPISPVNTVIGFSFVHSFFEIHCGPIEIRG
jgi:hypothetical protein